MLGERRIIELIIYFPLQRSEDDVSQFDTKFTKQIPVDSPDDSTLSESANLIFQVRLSLKVKLNNTTQQIWLPQGFTYVAPSVLEEMQQPRVVTARSPRRMPRHHHHHHHGGNHSGNSGGAGHSHSIHNHRMGGISIENGGITLADEQMLSMPRSQTLAAGAPHTSNHHLHHQQQQQHQQNHHHTQAPSAIRTQQFAGATGASAVAGPANSRHTPAHLQPFAPRPSPQDEMMEVYPELPIS